MLRDKRIVIGAALVAAGVLVAGCAKQKGAAEGGTSGAAAASAGSLPAGHPDVSNTTQRPPLKGVVTETMNAGGYTYVKLNVGGTDVWAAGPTTQLAVGDTISVSTAMPMENFTSKTLKKTFAKIYFTEGFLKPGQVTAQGMTGPGHGVVKQTIDASQYTYLEVASGDSTVWLAAPTTKVQKGQSVSWSNGTPMHDFTSKTLNRTFESILFVGKVIVEGAPSTGT
jgi:starvation-inducible outer membrane lipoprotein